MNKRSFIFEQKSTILEKKLIFEQKTQYFSQSASERCVQMASLVSSVNPSSLLNPVKEWSILLNPQIKVFKQKCLWGVTQVVLSVLKSIFVQNSLVLGGWMDG